MSLENIVQQIDLEIANLTNARNALAGLSGMSTPTSTNGSGKHRFTSAARARLSLKIPHSTLETLSVRNTSNYSGFNSKQDGSSKPTTEAASQLLQLSTIGCPATFGPPKTL
jgi:hypothetical protein